MKAVRTTFLLLAFLAYARPTLAQDEEARIDRVLTAFHEAAGRGDYDAYFALFAREAVFIGTDDWERWERPAFEAYARPRFARGGWKYAMTERHIYVAQDGGTAWFDEMLQNAGMGTARGSGVLILEGGDWKITQYNLSLPVPNEIADGVVERIRAFDERTRPAANPIEALADSLAASLVDSSRVAGLSIAVVQRGDTLVMKGYGFADLEYGIETPEHAVYEIGSVTKQFTAAATLRLASRGLIDLDAEITKYLPDFDTQGRRLTVARLLDHTSGLPGYTEMDEFGPISVQALPRDTLVSLMEQRLWWHEPGEMLIYNNSGYFLLGLVIEAVADTTYEAVLQREFFGPLGMEDTRYCSTTALVPRRTRGYDWTPDGLVRTAYLDHTWPFAAGSLCSSVEDLVTWNAALHGGRVLDARWYERLITPQPLNDGIAVRYAAGLVATQRYGHRQIAHGGGINGFVSDAVVAPDDALTVVVLVNSIAPGGPAAAVSTALVNAVLGQSVAPAVPLDLDPQSLVGTWTGPDRGAPGNYTIARTDVGFSLARGTRPATPLLYRGGGSFESADSAIRVFLEARPGMKPRLHLDQGYAYLVLQKTE